MSKGALRYRSEADMPPSMRGLLHATPGRHQGKSIAAKVEQTVTSLQRHATHRAGEMNKTEARYAQQLEALKVGGEIAWYAFEPMKLRLAKATFLTVDFLVKLPSGALECHEVKGRKGAKYFAEEDAKIKIKVAAEMFPIFRFLIVWPAKGGGWCQEQVG